MGWAPGPAKSGGNGCLKACLIVAVIGVIVAIIGIAGLVVLGGKLAEGIVNPDGSLKSCPLITNQQLSDALGREAEALPLSGIWDATMGAVLDKRVLKDAEDCWIAVGTSVSASATSDSATGRLAGVTGGDAAGTYRQEKDRATQGGYFAGDAAGIGDEAFCTAVSSMGSAGVLVRSGNQLIYVSLLTANVTGSSDACVTAQGIARRMLR